MNSLKLRSEDCSAFGSLVLWYLEQNPHTNMSQLAKQVKISRAGLGWICRKESNPDEETARKIAQIIGIDLVVVARLVHENKLERLANRTQLNYETKFSTDSVQIPIPKEDAIAGLNTVYQAFHMVTRTVPEIEKPTEFQIYKQAYEIVKRQFLSRKISRRQRSRLAG
ncbi:MAG: helix-turn-helix transcriptional regulator [Leptolyngbya sp. Prado105]|jgi:transcriptional regulator with XRE-family HTH domain|nr:helix-turn-helix transcriptional regulator [Leptolyngbya sp. Prado105]